MPTALVLGGSGLIGSACCRALSAAGRDRLFRDLSKLKKVRRVEILAGVDVIVTVADALRDGPRHDLNAVHATMVEQLCLAANNYDIRLVQISAACAAFGASTEFLRGKAPGDTQVQAARCEWVILRPTLVLATPAGRLRPAGHLSRGAASWPHADRPRRRRSHRRRGRRGTLFF